MRVLIADDEPVARQVLREHLEAIPSVELVGEAASGSAALESILQIHPDLVFLDQQMPELDGLNLVRALQPDHAPLIVFVTAYQQHALDAFDVGAIDYLLKPVRQERLEQAVEKARRQWRPGEDPTPDPVAVPAATKPASNEPLRRISGRRGEDIYLLEPAEIIAFQAEGDLVHVITAKATYLSDFSLKALEQKLPPAMFRRIRRGTLINTDHVRKISPLSSRRWMLKMSNGFEAVVSKRMAGSIRNAGEW